MWRNVESARAFAGAKAFAVLLAVEHEAHGIDASSAAAAALDGSLPHIAPDERRALSRHFLGFVTWKAIVERFALPAACLR